VEYAWERPFIVLSVTDARGIRALSGTLGGAELGFLPGTGVPWLPQGLHADLGPAPGDEDQILAFALQLQLTGTSDLAIAPVGKANSIVLTGDWPHPSFAGRFAPTHREVSDGGFTVEWQTTYWATGINEESLSRCVTAGTACALFNADQLGLRLVNPVDQYLLTERTVKYAGLFLLVSFSAFFMMEIMQKLVVHPVQYGLVGLALALFFLLTLSLSEHLPFNAAYWLAAGASIALLAYYVAHVLGGWRRGVGFSALLAGLYGLLFGILQSEDAALLMGSVALFGLLGAVMVLTRKVDWYSVSALRHAPEGTP
jgi:inner membrane protein